MPVAHMYHKGELIHAVSIGSKSFGHFFKLVQVEAHGMLFAYYTTLYVAVSKILPNSVDHALFSLPYFCQCRSYLMAVCLILSPTIDASATC